MAPHSSDFTFTFHCQGKPAQHIHLPQGGRTAPGKALSGRRFLGTNGVLLPVFNFGKHTGPRWAAVGTLGRAQAGTGWTTFATLV